MSMNAKAVSATYDDQPPVFEELSLEIPRGQLIGLTGDSGSDKTTLGRIMALLQPPSAGSLIIDGAPVNTNLRVATHVERNRRHAPPSSAIGDEPPHDARRHHRRAGTDRRPSD